MFTSLKNKIKEETGNDILPSLLQQKRTINRYNRNESFNSQSSIDDLSIIEQKDSEINLLKNQLNDLQIKLNDTIKKFLINDEQKKQYENDILLLEESVKLTQTQKDIIYDEQDKIQNLQSQELSKLKSLLVFREQEALDRLTILKQTQQQVDNLKNELLRVKKFEPMLEEVQDELEHMRHESQLEKNSLITNLAIVKEENRHLLSRLGILDDSRIQFSANLPIDEKIDILVKERKLLEQRLEEAHLHLSDVKSTWSGQNLALETQVSRLSRQVSEETNEKRKALKLLQESTEKLKKFEIDFEMLENEILQRNNKIKILEDEIDDLGTALKETRLENDEEITFLRGKVEENKKRKTELKSKISVSDMKINDIMENAEKNIHSLKQEIFNLEEQNRELNAEIEKENQEKRSILLKNAEISQSEELIKQELRRTRDEINECNERVSLLLEEVGEKELRIKELCNEIDQMKNISTLYRDKLTDFDTITNEVSEKNKLIKTLNQRLMDMKKTLQNELKTNTKGTTQTSQQHQYHLQQNQNNKNNHFNNYETKIKTTKTTISPPTTTIYKICQDHESGESKFIDYSNNGANIVMDEVNFKYLKHVIVKFLTSREVEARHLIRAVATLLHLTSDEEKLLHDTLNWKMSWFGAKPDHGTGQKAISIPPR